MLFTVSRIMKGLILTNAYSSAFNARQVKRLSEELAARGVDVEARRNDFFPAKIADGKIKVACDCDFCVYLDKDKYVSQMLEASGVRLFDRAQAIELCDDKMQTHIELAKHGIPMPDTLPGLLCYDDSAELRPEIVERAETLGYPLIVKLAYGSRGTGVFKANDRAELTDIMSRVKTLPHLFQKFVARSAGKDMRVIVVGGKALGAILRTSNVDFRSNIGLGGKARAVALPQDIRELAERTANILELDYCGIDFLLADEPLVCEVNSNAFFDAFEGATGINVAAAYAEHIISIMNAELRIKN